MISGIIVSILGLIAAVIIPCYLLSRILPEKLSAIEKACLSFGMLISAIVLLVFNLSALGYITGYKGITQLNAWASILVFDAILFIVAFWARGNNLMKRAVKR